MTIKDGVFIADIVIYGGLLLVFGRERADRLYRPVVWSLIGLLVVACVGMVAAIVWLAA